MHAAYASWFDSTRTPVPQPWDLHAQRGPVANSGYFAQMFLQLEQGLLELDPALKEPLQRLKVVVTPNPWELPLAGPDVLALVVLDNWGRVPRWADDVGLVLATNRGRRWADAVRMLPRPLGWLELLDEARVRVEREAWTRKGGRRPSGHNVVPVPLGYAHQRELPLVDWQDRDIDVFFAGSTTHALDRGGPLRRLARRSVGNVKTLHRVKMMDAVERVRRELPDLAVQVDIVDGDRVADHAGDYSERMARSRFCLDPRGTSRETWRFYEAVRVGTIPVVTSLPGGGLYAGAPALRLRHWSQLPAALRRMKERPEEARALHEAALRWYAESGGPHATAQRLLPHVARLLRSLPPA